MASNEFNIIATPSSFIYHYIYSCHHMQMSLCLSMSQTGHQNMLGGMLCCHLSKKIISSICAMLVEVSSTKLLVFKYDNKYTIFNYGFTFIKKSDMSSTQGDLHG